MSRYSRKKNISDQSKDEALKIARGTQKPGQTKEQTKLIAHGIQKGIDHYKKQHKAKARELNKKIKKASQLNEDSNATPVENNAQPKKQSTRLPWILLILSWLGFALYISLNLKH